MTARTVRAPVTGDVIVSAVAFGLTLALIVGAHRADRGVDVLGVILAVAACAPLVVHRRWPLAVFVLTAAASAALNGLGYAVGPPFGPTAALFFVAYDERTRDHVPRTVATVVGLFAVHVAATTAAQSGFPTSPILFGIVVWGGAWVAGDQVRQRRRRRRDLEEQLENAVRETARERRLAVAEERTRIARDLHDSAAHAINVILVQAGAARLLQQRDPGGAQAALTTIEEVARETIGEIDQLVRGLREDNGSAAVEPPTGLAALDTLVERHRDAGLRVDLRVDGRVRPLSRRLDQAAYRILQESLTNAARHGGGAADVRVHHGASHLELAVSNPVSLTGPAAPTGGHGILGMRERASLLGGSLSAGADASRFTVRARLPYERGEKSS